MNCRTCGAAIIWTTTEAGRKMPVNATPDPEGRVVFVDSDPTSRDPIVRVLKADEKTCGRTYTSHFVTCPQAGQHRRKR